MALIGYARVSTADQDLSLQVEKLKEYGCEKIFMEKQSGAKADRPELAKALEYLREGDKLVVYKIDRLARSTFDLHKIARELTERGIGLVFIKEKIDFSTPAGKLMFTMLAAIAEFERDLINERTREGRERAKAMGKHMGRPSQPEKQIQKALKLYQEREINGLSVKDISQMTGVPRSTIYAKVRQLRESERLKNIASSFLEQTNSVIKAQIESWVNEGQPFEVIKEKLKAYCGNDKDSLNRVLAIMHEVMDEKIEKDLENFVL